MDVVATFDPSLALQGTFNSGLTNNGKIVVYNESNIGLQLQFANGETDYLGPWLAQSYHLSDISSSVVQWTQLFTLASNLSVPVSKVIVVRYQPFEKIIGTFPTALVRQTNIGNAVQSMTSTNQVTNDGTPAPFYFIESTQQGNTGGPNVQIGNDGSYLYAQWVSSIYSILEQLVPGANPVLKWGPKLILQALDNSGANLSNIFGVDGSGNTFIQSHKTNNKTVIYDKNGVALLTVNGATQGLEIPTSAASITGTTAGSAQLYMPFTGAFFKLAILVFAGYQNNSVTEQTIPLPVAFGARCNWLAGNGKPVRPYLSGTALTNKVNVNNNGTATQGNTVNSNNMGEIIQGFDALGLGTSEVSAASAIYLFVGL